MVLRYLRLHGVWITVSLLLALLLICRVNAAPQLIYVPVPPPALPAVDRATMETPVRVDFESVRLEDALKSISDQSGFEILVHWDSLKSEAIEPTSHFTLHLKNPVALETALRLVLAAATANGNTSKPDFGQTDTSLIEVGDTIREEPITLAVPYNVRDFIDPDGFSTADMRDSKARWLTNTLTGQISPETWRDNGGTSGSISMDEDTGLMVIKNYRWVQERIAALLEQMRAARGKQH